MRKQIVNTFVSIVTVAMFMVGCGSSSATPTVTAEVSEAIPTANINGGVVTAPTVLDVNSTDGTKLAEVTLETGTGFTNPETNETITETPKVAVKASQSTTARTEVSFTLADGTKVIPTEPVRIALTAPAGAKEGDKVTIDVPDGVTAGTKKLTVFIVGKNGLINVIVAPQVFKNADVYVIVFVVKLEPTTGGQ